MKLFEPLSSQVPIVNEQGKPTAQFQRVLQKISVGNGIVNDNGTLSLSIPDNSITTAKLVNAAVTNAKLANMVTKTIKARKSGTTGAPEDCTLSELLDFVGSAVQGDILFRSSTGWTRLGAGTAGYVLTTNGTGANPSWTAASGGGGGGSAPTIVQQKNCCISNGIGSVTFTSTPTAGNLLIAVGTRWTVAIATAAGWTRLFDEGSQTDDTAVIFWKVAGASESTTQTFSTTTSGWAVTVFEINGAAPPTILNYFGDATLASASTAAMNAGVAKANCLGLGVFMAQLRTTPTFTVTGGTASTVSSDASTTNGGARSMVSVYQTITSAGAWQPSCTFGSAGINGYAYAIVGAA